MISALKSGLRGGLFYLVFFFILLLLLQFFFPTRNSSTCINPLNNFLSNVNLVHNNYLAFLLNGIPVLLSLRILTKLIVSYSIIDKNNIFPVFLMLLHFGATPQNLFELNLRFWAVFLLLYAYYNIIITYKRERSNTELFISGFFMLLTFYVDPFFLFSFLLLIISLFSFRAMKFHEFFAFISGIFFSLIIIEFMLHLFDIVAFYPFRFLINYQDFFGLPALPPLGFLVFTFIFILLNFSIFFLSIQSSGLSVLMSKNRQIMIYWVFLASISFFIRCHLWEYIFLTVSIPFSILVGETLFYIKNNKIQLILFYTTLSFYLIYFLYSREIIII